MAKGSYDDLYGKYGRQKKRSPAAPQKDMRFRKMKFIDKVKNIVMRPSEFFEDVRYEDDVMPAFRYVGFFIFIYSIVAMALYIHASSLFTINLITIILMSVGVLMYYILYMMGTFAGAGLMHVIIKTFKGNGNYIATYKAISYSLTPYFLFGWIILYIVSALLSPLVTQMGGLITQFVAWLILGAYIIYLQTMGISKLHGISKLRAFLIIMLPIIVSVVMVGLLYVYISDIFASFLNFS